jgi:CRP/FNR family cyclic AMP-dependent transcriptional regulator
MEAHHHDRRRRLRDRLPRDGKTEQIRGIALFASCKTPELKAVASLTTEVAFPAGMKLAVQGTVQREVLVLTEGGAAVFRDGEQLSDLGPGDSVGELAAIARASSPATVTTTRPSRALVMRDLEFIALLDVHPQLARPLLEAVARRQAPAAA